MSQYTRLGLLGYPGGWNDSDFTTAAPPAAASGQWTRLGYLGYAAGWNDSDFTTAPGGPGGDYLLIEETFDAVLSGTLADFDTISLVVPLLAEIVADEEGPNPNPSTPSINAVLDTYTVVMQAPGEYRLIITPPEWRGKLTQ